MSQAYTLKADGELIQWLLHESGQSRYSISMVTKVSESTLSRLAADVTFLQRMRFENAAALTSYAKHLQAHQKRVVDATTRLSTDHDLNNERGHLRDGET